MPTQVELLKLWKRADQGDVEANRELSEFCKDRSLECVRLRGLAETIRSFLTKQLCPDQALHSQFTLRQESQLVGQSMVGPNPNGIEQLLAEQISLDWFVLRAAEVSLANIGEVSFKDAYWRQSRVDTAHNRLMSSIRTLAQVRKLQIPDLVQVNVALQKLTLLERLTSRP